MTPPIRYDLPAYSVGPTHTLPDHLISEHNGAVAWWSNVKREGEWILSRHFRSFTCMGNIEIDLRCAHMAAGVSEMELNCFMGNIEVIVPPEIRVLCNGDGMLGSFDVERIGNTNPPPDAPTIKISGTAYMGSITVKVIDPNAPKWADRLKAGWASLTE